MTNALPEPPPRIARIHPRMLSWLLPLGVAAMAVFAGLALRFNLAYPCPFKSVFSLPCATCGGTRAFAALAGLRPIEAFLYNPLLVTAAIALFAGAVFRHRFSKWVSRLSLPVIVGAVLLNWLYLILFLPR